MSLPTTLTTSRAWGFPRFVAYCMSNAANVLAGAITAEGLNMKRFIAVVFGLVLVVAQTGVGVAQNGATDIRICPFDSGSEDGDAIYVEFDGETIFSSLVLTLQEQCAHVSKQPGRYLLLVRALNEGNAPPNTAAITIRDSEGEMKDRADWELATGEERHWFIAVSDDDISVVDPGLRVSLSTLALDEGGRGTYTVELESEPSGTVTVAVNGTNADVSVQPASLIFTRANWDISQTMTVHAAHDDDSIDDSATLTLQAIGGGYDGRSANVSVVISDDDMMVADNAAPMAVGAIPALTLEAEDDAVTQDVAAYFTDPDGDTLAYSASSSNADIATVSIFGSELTVTGVAEGTATVTVTATDMDGLSASQRVRVTVSALQQTQEVVDDVVEGVVSSTISNVTTNIGTRFSAARGGTAVTVAGLPVAFGDTVSALAAFNDHSQPGLRGGYGDDFEGQYLTLDRFLQSSAFQVALAADHGDALDAAPGPSLTVWGRVDSMFFEKESGDPERYDGELKAGYVGLDTWLDERWLIGVAASLTIVDAAYGTGDGGKLDLNMLGVHPYARLALDDVSELWLILGFSRGIIQHTPAGASGRTERSDITMYMGAAGVRRQLTSVAGIDIAFLGDAGLGSLRSGKGSGLRVIGNLAADAWRGRLGFAGSHTISLEGLATFTPFVEVVGRYDGGEDANAGVEIAAGAQYADPASGFGLELRGNVLPVYSEEDYREYGFSLSVSASPGVQGEGLAMHVATSLGPQSGDTAALWRENLLGSATGADRLAESLSLNAEVGYGFPIVGSKGVLTPFGGLRLRNGGGQQMRTGVRFGRMASARPWNLELAGEQHTSDVRAPEYRLNVLGRVRF